MTRVIVTHPNPDKFNGLSVFHAAGIESIASERQGAHFKAIQAELVKAYPDYAMPDLVGYSVYGLEQQKRGQ